MIFFSSKTRSYRQFVTLLPLVLGIVGIWIPNCSEAQAWQWVRPVAGMASETITGLIADEENTYFCGHFANTLAMDDLFFTTVGNTDAFLAAKNADGQTLWAITGNSPGADVSADVAQDHNGHIYWTGAYWFDAEFNNLTLSTTKSAKALFVVKTTTSGDPLWAKSIEGTGNKSVGAMTADTDGNTYVTGHFSDSLFFDNVAVVARADTDFFLLKINTAGDLVWLEQAGISGDIELLGMHWDGENRVAVTGTMRGGQYNFGNDTIQNNTNDADAFVAVYYTDGNELWARKIGGVNEQNASDVIFDSSGNCYAAGSFFGVIRLDESLQIQSPNIADNLYLIKYDLDGTPVWARSIGNLETELAQDLAYQHDQLFLSGYFRQQFMVDGFTLTGNVENFNSFILELDTDGVVQSALEVTSPEIVLLAKLATQNESLYYAGALDGTVNFGDLSLSATDGYDSFVGKLNDLINGISVQQVEKKSSLFPNPTNGNITVLTDSPLFKIEVFNINQQLILETTNTEMDLTTFPSGIYFFKILKDRNPYHTEILRVIKQ